MRQFKENPFNGKLTYVELHPCSSALIRQLLSSCPSEGYFIPELDYGTFNIDFEKDKIRFVLDDYEYYKAVDQAARKPCPVNKGNPGKKMYVHISQSVGSYHLCITRVWMYDPSNDAETIVERVIRADQIKRRIIKERE